MKTIQRIFSDHADTYLQRNRFRMSLEQRKVLKSVCECRTGRAGRHVYICPICQRQHIADSSCGNRHCPVCQNNKAADWVYRQELKQLGCTYFMATFTLPFALRSVARQYPKQIYSALFRASAESLKMLESDDRFIGCDLAGFFGVLHTWGRQMQYHPHIHYVIAGGGLSKDRTQWIASPTDFLVHVRALSALFKGKFRATLAEHSLASIVPNNVWQDDWVVHCKAVGNGAQVLKYLGAYVFRVAISDARILHYDGTHVTFRYRKVGASRPRKCTLPVMEFIRRFMQHVLPRGFMKIRHYGFLSSQCSIAIERIRNLIDASRTALCCILLPRPPAKPTPLVCTHCSVVMHWVRFLPPIRGNKAGP